MFVNKIPRWKIKRFIKGVIRSILFFVVISSFIFNCSAAENWVYSSFHNWVSNNGTVDYLLRNSSSQIVKSGTIYGYTSNLNEMVFANNYSSSFDSVRMTIEDSPNVITKVNPGDSLLLRHQIAVHMANGVVNDNYAKKFTVDINYTYGEEGLNLGSLSFRFDDALSGYNYIQYDYGVSVFYNVDIQAVFSNNVVNGEIVSIDYHFYDITSNSYSFQIFPSYNQSSIVYYVGPTENAPVFSSPDYSSLDDYKESEDALLDVFDSGEDRFNDFFNSFSSNNKLSLFNWVGAASEIFTIFFDRVFTWHFTPLIEFLLIVGIFGFLLSIVSVVVRSGRR